MDTSASRGRKPVSGPNQQWTATRCHRLLRPLLTHITALRKEISWQETFRPGQQLAPDQQLTPDQQPARARVGDDAHESGSKHRDDDAFTARKRARYTYSLKGTRRAAGRRGSAQSCERGAQGGCGAKHEAPSGEGMMLATPVLKRARGDLAPSSIQRAEDSSSRGAWGGGKCRHFRACCPGRCVFELELASLKERTVPFKFALYESIFRAMDALLRAASAQEPCPRGPESLLAMCLRSVPDYITELECWEREDAEATNAKSALGGSKVSFEIYSELETLGAGGGGWKHLCDVVRAHAIKIVKAAIVEGLIDSEFAILLARLCNESSSFADREELVTAIISRKYAKPSGPDDWFARSADTAPLDILVPSRRRTWAEPFRARGVEVLLTRQLLPREWILTRDFGTVWSWIVRDIARKHPGHDTTALVIASIRPLCSHMLARGRKGGSTDKSSSASLQMLTSALTALVTTALLGQQTLSQDSLASCHDHSRSINRRVEYIIRACLAATATASGYGAAQRRLSTYVLLLAAFFLDSGQLLPTARQPDPGPAETALRACWDEPDNGRQWRQRYDATLALACSVAQSCARGSAAPASAHLAALCERLAAARVPPPAAAPPSSFRRDAAFLLADMTGDLRDLASAEGLRGGPRHPAGATTTTTTTAFAGFRWDAGISEWVTAAPDEFRPQASREQKPGPPPKLQAARKRGRGSLRSKRPPRPIVGAHVECVVSSEDELGL